MLIEPPGNPRNEGGRQEHRHKNERDGDNGSGYLLHGLEARVARRQSLLDVMFHGLDHDDGIIHHQPDGQHQPKERQRVDGKSEQREHDEGTEERHRYGEQGDERRSPVLKEDEYHDNHETERLQKRGFDLFQSFGHGERGIHCHAISESWRESGFRLFHELAHAVGGRDRIAAG